MLRSLLLAAAAAVVATGAAHAADLIPAAPATIAPAAYDWTGFYAGVFGGWGHSDTVLSFSGDPDRTISGNGGLLGGTIGYNAALADNVVIGGEARLGWGNINGDYTGGATDPGYYTSNIGWLASVTAKLGYTVDNLMLYVDAGGAIGGVNHDGFDAPGLADTEGAWRSVNAGWTAGAGLAYAVTDHLTADLSYNYYDLGSADFPLTSRDDGYVWFSPAASTKAHVVSAGLNYRF